MADKKYVREKWSYQVRDKKDQEARAASLKNQMDAIFMNDPMLFKFLKKAPRR